MTYNFSFSTKSSIFSEIKTLRNLKILAENGVERRKVLLLSVSHGRIHDTFYSTNGL